MSREYGRIAVVGTAAIFRKRAGNAAYLASFCRALRAMGFRVEVLFLDRIPEGRIQLRLYRDYLETVDAVSMRQTVRSGPHFFSTNAGAWGRAALHRAGRALFGARGATTNPPRRSNLWKLRWPSDDALDWARQRLSSFQPDAVVANYFNASRAFGLVDPACYKAVLTHDVFALRKESYEAHGYPLDFDENMIVGEAEALSAADLCVTITRGESNFISSRYAGLRMAVFPFTVDVLARRAREPRKGRCVFVGSDNDPNRRALAWLLNEVWPHISACRPEIELRVVGTLRERNDPGRFPNVAFLGPVEDLTSEYFEASVALVPLRAGSGLKVKLVEALAHGVPVVSTTPGADGIGSASPNFLRVHDDPESFAEAVDEIVTASDWARRSEQAGAFARDNFSTRAAEAALESAFEPIRKTNTRVRGRGSSLLSGE